MKYSDLTGNLINMDKLYLWHPFTQMKNWIEEEQIIIEKGDGNYLFDTDGNKYFDGVSSLWCNLHGHKHPELNKAIVDQTDKIAHSTMLGLGNISSITLAKNLIEIAPKNLKKVFYSDSGATAVEIALKMAFQYWYNKGEKQRTKYIILSDSYHGDTIGSVSLGGIDRFHKIFNPLLFHSHKIPAPYCYRCPLNLKKENCSSECLKEAEKVINKYKNEIVALVIEPLIQGAGGMIIQPKGYLKELDKLCKQNDILLICDEVATGFGRTGTMFAVEQEKVEPDLMALAKGITGGYLPLAATLASEKIFNAFLGDFDEFKTFFHGHTYTGNPVACSVAIANLEIFNKENVIEKLNDKILYLEKKLKTLSDIPQVGDIRQKGLMVGIELTKNRDTKEEFTAGQRIGHKVILEARKRGVIIRPLGDIIVLMPPLSTKIDEIEMLVEVVKQSIISIVNKAS